MSIEKNNFKHVTVLGGFGFIGRHLCRALLLEGYQVRVFSRQDSVPSVLEDIRFQMEIVKGDITCPKDVLGAIENTDVVIHLVHTTSPGTSMTDPLFDICSNVVATAQWASCISKTSVRRIIYISSGGTVYGVPQSKLISECHPTDPICSYGITKLAIEKYLSMYAMMHGIESFIIRPSNIYGEGQKLNKGQGVIGILLNRTLRGEPLEVWGRGEELRDYIFVDDMISAILKILKYRGGSRTFNIGSGKGHSVLDIIDCLRHKLGTIPEIIHKSARGFDVPINILDSNLLQIETGWRSCMSLDDGIEKVILGLRND